MPEKSSVKIVRTIHAAPDMVFAALTQAVELRGWMCQEAYTEPRKDGYIRLRWSSGYNVMGAFTTFAPPARLSFTWLSANEPGETTVKITLKPVEGGAKITLVHAGFGPGKKWAGRSQESEQGWNKSLDNLKSVLETGLDRRTLEQPRIGMGFESVKGGTGVIVTQIIPDGPAAKAGLQPGDWVTRLAGKKVLDESGFAAIFSQCRAGQKAKIAYVREGRQRTTMVEFGARPVPQVSDDPAVVVEQARQIHAQMLAALRTSVAALTDEQAERQPAPGEWSVKQALAHLCVCEPEYRAWATRALLGGDANYWVEARLPEQFATVLNAKPTLHNLLDRLERELAESRIFIAALTPERRAYKARYRHVALMLLDFAYHIGMHLEQIQKTIKAIQKT
jgi:uncharacterized protein YndB with AHSA1/START domain/uncharacterized damage-inducible protein DinB